MYSTFLEELQVSTFIIPLPHSAAFRQSLNCRPKFLCVQQPIIVTCTLIPTVPSLVMGAGFSWGRKMSGLSIEEKGNWDETSDLSRGYLAFCLLCSHPQSSGFSFWVPIVPSRGFCLECPGVLSPPRTRFLLALVAGGGECRRRGQTVGRRGLSAPRSYPLLLSCTPMHLHGLPSGHPHPLCHFSTVNWDKGAVHDTVLSTLTFVLNNFCVMAPE